MNNTSHVISLIAKIKHKANQIILQELNKNGIHGLVASHGDILIELLNADTPLTMHKLARGIQKDTSNITALVNKLYQQGFVTKECSLKDKRVIYISLTHKGYALQPTFEKISAELLKKVYKNFSEEEKKTLIALLEKMAKHF
ncbi:MarR family winged helix-turn-helix transcriptional regulator [Sulfurospirillum sp. 1612]|uniref:MarR family winged helix-turn-helix transcriptional regulator n=1 Tax=Sulfurospirillum sp. 1612 TaxID=3094835 RepID=UPI002F93C4F9